MACTPTPGICCRSSLPLLLLLLFSNELITVCCCAAGERDAIVFRRQTSHNNEDVHCTRYFCASVFFLICLDCYYLLWSLCCELHLVNNDLLLCTGCRLNILFETLLSIRYRAGLLFFLLLLFFVLWPILLHCLLSVVELWRAATFIGLYTICRHAPIVHSHQHKKGAYLWPSVHGSTRCCLPLGFDYGTR